MDSDKTSIDEVTGAFFDAFTNRGGAPSNIDCLYRLFLPECVIVGIGASGPNVYEQFVRMPDGWKIAALTWEDDA